MRHADITTMLGVGFQNLQFHTFYHGFNWTVIRTWAFCFCLKLNNSSFSVKANIELTSLMRLTIMLPPVSKGLSKLQIQIEQDSSWSVSFCTFYNLPTNQSQWPSNINPIKKHLSFSDRKLRIIAPSMIYNLLTIAVEELKPILDPVTGPQSVNLLVLLDEGDEGGPLHLHRLARPEHHHHHYHHHHYDLYWYWPVIESDDKVEEVRFPQVSRRLLLKVSPPNSRRPANREQRVSKVKLFNVY